MRIVKNSISGNYIVTHAVGFEYLKRWELYSLPSWELYCKGHDIGIIVIENQIADVGNKNIYWDKFLIPNVLAENSKSIVNICYLDTDVVINPFSENIFITSDLNKINLVSQTKQIPYMSEQYVRKKVAFNRNKYLDKNYPLQSSLFMPYEDIFKLHNLPVYDNYACTGVFLININKYADLMLDWYNSVPSEVYTIDNGEEVYLNHFFQRTQNINWLGYQWQALWIYEIANNYSFLYREKFTDEKIVEACVVNSLANYNFLHFAGSWESSCWKQCQNIFANTKDNLNISYLKDFFNYRNQPIEYAPVGQIRPSKK